MKSLTSKKLILLLCLNLLIFFDTYNLCAQINRESEDTNNAACQFNNGQVNIQTDTVCENSFIVETVHSLIDSTGTIVQCPYYDVHFYILDSVSLSPDWIHLGSFSLGSHPNNPASFVGNFAFDIKGKMDSLLGFNYLNCGESYTIMYLVGEFWNPNNSNSINSNDTVRNIADIHYKCKTVNQVLVNPSQIPIQTCGEPITLSTNYSSNPNNIHTWHRGSPSGPIVSSNSTAIVSIGDWYYVYVDNQNSACDSGRGTTLIADSSFATTISSSGPNTIDCGVAGSSLPTLSLDNSSNFSNHIFQWFFTNSNGFTQQINSATNPQYVASQAGDYFLVTTNLSTGCVDTSNIISITTIDPPGPFNLSLFGDTIYCQGETINNFFKLQPAIAQPKVPPYWTFEVFNGSNYVGNTLNNLAGNGNYSVIITNPAGCKYYTDTINVNIDTLGIPNDSIYVSGGYASNNLYCQYSTITLTNNDYSPSIEVNHQLSINGVNINTIFSNGPDYSIDLSTTGWQHLLVISNYPDVDCYDTLFNMEVYVLPEGCCNDIASLTLLHGQLDPGTVYSGDYLVVEDIYTVPNRFHDLSGGNFVFIGKAIKDPDSYGGQAIGTNLILKDSSEVRAVNSYFNAYCDTMWGGILLKPFSNLQFDNSLLANSYFGIRPDTNLVDAPGPDLKYYVNGGENIFQNNYISVSYYANAKDSPSSSGFLAGSFTCIAEGMLFPFDLQSNDNRESYSYKAVDVYAGNSHSVQKAVKAYQASANQYGHKIINHIYGIYLNEGAQFDTVGDALMENMLVAGYYIGGKSNELIIGFDSINFQSYGRNRKWQQSKEYAIHPEFNTRGYGIFSQDRTIQLEFSSINGDGFSSSTGNLNDYSVGISSNSNLTLDLSRIIGMDYGTRIRANQLDINISDDILSDNVYGLYLEEDVQANLIMGCTQFIKNSNNGLTHYGIYVESGASILNNIGGNQTPSNPGNPAGNGWPVDPTSPGHPFTTNGGGSGVNVFNWQWPENWYSIYDANAANEFSSLGYQYFTYNNEFFGESNNQNDWAFDAVFPTNIIQRTAILEGGSPCINVPSIIYPTTRVGANSLLSNNRFDEFKVFPNPAKNVLHLKFPDNLKINVDVELVNLEGVCVFYKDNLNPISNEIIIDNLNKGFYIINILSENGQFLSRSKLIKD